MTDSIRKTLDRRFDEIKCGQVTPWVATRSSNGYVARAKSGGASVNREVFMRPSGARGYDPAQR
jgi:hypothetical protein